MGFRRTTKLLVEPPSGATGDIAFNLIVFFLVCASVQPDSGRQQEIPRSEENQQKEEVQNIEVALTSNEAAVSLNGDAVRIKELVPRLTTMLKGKPRPEDKIVIVKSKLDTPYHHWITVTGMIEESGGLVTIQREEVQTVQVQ